MHSSFHVIFRPVLAQRPLSILFRSNLQLVLTIKSNTKKILFLLLSVGLVAIIGLKLYRSPDAATELARIAAQIRGPRAVVLVLALGLAPANWLLESLKWRYLTKSFKQQSLGHALASVLTGMSMAFVSPGKIGDFAGRALYFSRQTRLRAVIATLVGNLAQVIITFLMGSIGLIVLNCYSSGWWQLGLLGVCLCSFAILLVLYLHIQQLQPYMARISWLGRVGVALSVLKRYDRRDLLRILGFSLLKLSVYTAQFVLLAYVFGTDMPLVVGYFISFSMFWLITVIPSFFVADIIVRGYVADLLLVGTGIASAAAPVLAGSYAIWLVNWLLPSLIGAMTIALYRWKKQ